MHQTRDENDLKKISKEASSKTRESECKRSDIRN